MLFYASHAIFLVFMVGWELGNGKVKGDVYNVSAVMHKTADLPCDISPPSSDDRTHLVLWYKEGSGSPIYSLDLRGNVDSTPSSQSGSSTFPTVDIRTRVSFRSAKSPATLAVNNVRGDDEGIYRCRIDFKTAPSRNQLTYLSVIVPPEVPAVLGEKGQELGPRIGPYNEGSSLFLSCEVVGGRPPPVVVWIHKAEVVDDTYEVTSLGTVRNDLAVQFLSRDDFHAIYTCQATNNNISTPVKTSVTVDMNLKPLDVRIENKKQSLSSHEKYTVICHSTGSRPSPIISWWLGSRRLKNSDERVSTDGNTTTVTLVLVPHPEDHNKALSCKSENPRIPGSAIEDVWTLDVQFSPMLTLGLGGSLKDDEIREGDDVYLECKINANPYVTSMQWRLNGAFLPDDNNTVPDESGSFIIKTNHSLIIKKVQKKHLGLYSCAAENGEGQSESHKYTLKVKHKPVCKISDMTVYGVARNESVEVVCEVESNPLPISFRWAFNKPADTYDTRGHMKVEKGRSTLKHVPRMEKDFGVFYCWATNVIGTQAHPCVFTVTAAGIPDPVSNCTMTNLTDIGVAVSCKGGYDGGLSQQFICEVYDSNTQDFKMTLTHTEPNFAISGLEPGSSVQINIYASNLKGKSEPASLTTTTIKIAESRLGLNLFVTNTKRVFSSLLEVMLGIVGALAIIIIMIVLLMRNKTHNHQIDNRHDYKLTEKHNGGSPQESRSRQPLRREYDSVATTANENAARSRINCNEMLISDSNTSSCCNSPAIQFKLGENNSFEHKTNLIANNPDLIPITPGNINEKDYPNVKVRCLQKWAYPNDGLTYRTLLPNGDNKRATSIYADYNYGNGGNGYSPTDSSISITCTLPRLRHHHQLPRKVTPSGDGILPGLHSPKLRGQLQHSSTVQTGSPSSLNRPPGGLIAPPGLMERSLDGVAMVGGLSTRWSSEQMVNNANGLLLKSMPYTANDECVAAYVPLMSNHISER